MNEELEIRHDIQYRTILRLAELISSLNLILVAVAHRSRE